MGDQWELLRGQYISDSGTIYIVSLRDAQITAGGFTVVDSSTYVTLPRGFKMRYVLGTDQFTGAVQKLFIAYGMDPIFTAGGDFIYGDIFTANTFTVSARISESYPNRG
jgi:hypothetical protein